MYFPRRCGGLSPLTALKMFQVQKDRRSRLGDYKKIIVSSEHMRREYERHGIDPERLRMVSYPVTGMGLEREPYTPLPVGGSLVFVGRLTDLKGVDLALRAIPEASQRLGRSLTLTVVGDGPELPRLQDLAQRLGVQAEFPGWLTSSEKLAFLRQANLLVVPSWWPEPFGLAGAEAGRLSVPAVGYAVGGVPEWLVPGRSGELAAGDPPTVEGLAAAMVRALSDPNHYARLRRGAWEVSGQFSMNEHLTQLEEIIEQVQIDAGSAAVPSVQLLDLESGEYAEKRLR
jgi:glycosyltransferase involved in cell wall biosynthesis